MSSETKKSFDTQSNRPCSPITNLCRQICINWMCFSSWKVTDIYQTGTEASSIKTQKISIKPTSYESKLMEFLKKTDQRKSFLMTNDKGIYKVVIKSQPCSNQRVNSTEIQKLKELERVLMLSSVAEIGMINILIIYFHTFFTTKNMILENSDFKISKNPQTRK